MTPESPETDIEYKTQSVNSRPMRISPEPSDLPRLKKVMNPLSGLDLVRTKLVEDIEVMDGEV